MSGTGLSRPPGESPGKESESTYRLDGQIGHVLRRAHQRHIALFTRQIGDLTPQQFAALAKLREVGRTSQNQLGSLIAMDAATVKGVIDRLRARGYVELRRNEEDRRRLMVDLTETGRQAVETLLPLAQQVSDETLSPLSSSEAALLLKLLSKLA